MNKKIKRHDQRLHPVYNHSYILHLWLEDSSSGTGWRVSLEDPHTGERFGFANLEQFFTFLIELIVGDSDPS